MTPEEIKAAEDKRLADEAAAEAAKKAKDEDPDAGKTAAEIEAEAKEAEEKLKAKKEDSGLSDEEKEAKKKSDQIKRRDNALAKLKDSDDSKQIATEDLVTLGVKNIDPESETAKVLQRYVEAGFVKNYKAAFDHPGVKAELEALEADKTAKTVIDENGSEDAKLATKKERIANYRASGEVPTDAKLQKEIADANLAEMGLM